MESSLSKKPSAVLYIAPIFLGIIGSVLMWFILKDEEHPSAPKMIKKGWIIGIILSLISVIGVFPFTILSLFGI